MSDPRKALATQLLRELSEAPGVSGNEGAVRAILRRRLEPVGPISSDRLGSLLCTKISGLAARPRVMLDSHMDEVGFCVQSITAEGFLKMVPVGGWWGHVLPSQRVKVVASKGPVPGVIASVPPHFLKPEERQKVREVEDLFVDVAARGADDATGRLGIRLGDPIVPDTAFRELGSPDIVSGKAFDDRAGCAVMVQAMLEARGHPNTLIGVGAVQEEVGCRGAGTAAEVAEPDLALVLEGTPADDVPGAEGQGRQGVLGRGVQIRFFDPSMISHRALANFAIETARAEGIPHQVAVRRSGGTDGSRIHVHRTGVPSIVLGVPVRYIHSHVSILDLSDSMAALDLVLALVGRLDEKTYHTTILESSS